MKFVPPSSGRAESPLAPGPGARRSIQMNHTPRARSDRGVSLLGLLGPATASSKRAGLVISRRKQTPGALPLLKACGARRRTSGGVCAPGAHGQAAATPTQPAAPTKVCVRMHKERRKRVAVFALSTVAALARWNGGGAISRKHARQHAQKQTQGHTQKHTQKRVLTRVHTRACTRAYHSFVNALTSAEVTEPVPVNTNISHVGQHAQVTHAQMHAQRLRRSTCKHA